MKPINEYIKEPNMKTGGCLVTLTGPPGCGKTNTLVQLAINRFEEGQKVLWRGTDQAQWAAFEANDVPVKVWIDDNISRLEAWVSEEDTTKNVDVRSRFSEVERFEDETEVVEKASSDHINVCMVPGMLGEKHEKYYFRKTWINILEALVKRKNVAEAYSFFTDEGGDLWPCQQQLRKPFYSLVVEQTPPLLSQLRKQNVFMYIAAHSTHDLHYFVWKIKGNTIAYMSNANVQRDIHTSVDQTKVNKLDRGEMVVPPVSRASFKLAYEQEDLDWVSGGKFRVKSHADIPNKLEDEDDSGDSNPNPQTVKTSTKKEIAANLYEDDDLNLSQKDIADKLGISQGSVSNAVSS